MINQNLDHIINTTKDTIEDHITLERIPEALYQNMTTNFAQNYHFENGERMRISNYFVKISRNLSDTFVQFIQETIQQLQEHQFPNMPAPEGFNPHPKNLVQTEQETGFSLGSFDMAVTATGLQNIEFQAVATYPISAAKLNQYILEHIPIDNAFIFADHPKTDWKTFINIYTTLLAGNEQQGIVLTDRKIKTQKTNFEFFATQKELDIPIEIVDMEHIFEKDDTLYYSDPLSDQDPIKITRLYNRILLAEALFEDHYPRHTALWKFRFDKPYQDLKYVNHPIRQFEVSKRLSPYINHPSNPECFELAEVAQEFLTGTLAYTDYIFKHKWGAAGHRLILEPTAAILESLTNELEDYIVQKKVAFKVFTTDDGQEKIVELRFMTAIHEDQMIIVPMARIGHVTKDPEGNENFKIHFGDNNKEGYGFSPVIIVGQETL